MPIQINQIELMKKLKKLLVNVLNIKNLLLLFIICSSCGLETNNEYPIIEKVITKDVTKNINVILN